MTRLAERDGRDWEALAHHWRVIPIAETRNGGPSRAPRAGPRPTCRSAFLEASRRCSNTPPWPLSAPRIFTQREGNRGGLSPSQEGPDQPQPVASNAPSSPPFFTSREAHPLGTAGG